MIFYRFASLVLSGAIVLAVGVSFGTAWCGEATPEQNLALLKQIDADLVKKPGDLNFLCRHAELMGKMKRYQEEVSEASKIIGKFPKARDAFLIQAHGLGNLERSADAIKSLDRAFSLGAPTPELLVLKATHLRREKKYKEAIAVLSKVIEQHPGYSPAYDSRSVCYYRLYGPCKLALDDLEAESRLQPPNAETKTLIQELKKKLAANSSTNSIKDQ